MLKDTVHDASFLPWEIYDKQQSWHLDPSHNNMSLSVVLLTVDRSPEA